MTNLANGEQKFILLFLCREAGFASLDNLTNMTWLHYVCANANNTFQILYSSMPFSGYNLTFNVKLWILGRVA